MISSPLSSYFEKCVLLKTKINVNANDDDDDDDDDGYSFVIGMSNMDCMLVENGNVRIIPHISGLLNFVKLEERKLVALVRTTNDGLGLKQLDCDDGDFLNWNIDPSSSSPIFLDFSGVFQSYSFKKRFDRYTVMIDDELHHNDLIVIDESGNKKLTILNSINTDISKVIDVTHLMSNSSRIHLIVILNDGRVFVFVLSGELDKIVNKLCMNIQNLGSVSYVEMMNCLEILDDNGNTHSLIDMNTLKLVKSSISGLKKVEIYPNDQSSPIDDLPVLVNDHVLGTGIELISLDNIIKDTTLASQLVNILDKTSTNIESPWLAMHDQSGLLNFIPLTTTAFNKLPVELITLLGIILNEQSINDYNISELILSYTLDNFHDLHVILISLSSLCLSSDQRISKMAFQLLDDLLAGIGYIDDGITHVWLPILMREMYWISYKDELLVVYSTLIFAVLLSHDYSKLYSNNKELAYHLIDKIIKFVKCTDNVSVVCLGLKLLRTLGLTIFKMKMINPVELLVIVFEILSDKTTKAAIVMDCNDYLNSMLLKNECFMIVMISFLLSLPGVSPSLQMSILDYINYILIEKSTDIAPNTMFILINSLIVFLTDLQDFNKIPSLQYHELWGSLDLTANILTTNFNKSLASNFIKVDSRERNHDLLNLSKHEAKLCLILDDSVLSIGFQGVIFINSAKHTRYHHEKNWSIIPLKIGTQSSQSENVVKSLQNLIDKMGTEKSLRNPVFNNQGNLLACFDFNDYSIRVWNLFGERSNTGLDINIINDSRIPLKVDDFNLLFMQTYWNSNEDLKHNLADASLLQVLHDFQGMIGNNNTSSIGDANSSDRHRTNVINHHRDQQSEGVLESYLQISIVDLMSNYLSVFTDITINDLSLEWVAHDKLGLKLQGKIVFVYSV
ncbi:hypothetical protein CANARDRAFT_28644 [[Candida] arabinofermentans NRRL YB-2248]|uniref:Uncharacterized protein n=1 Tax=[Candida] arabinofermentans NRRL YB-2248 TaxID=983967 RepID=A0A1E4SZL7_9ASCO|nr:hypothetical protein CANARDRAFT_28644 [[Candida] arabinofermentans NRRL YB-2248]